MAKSIEEKIVKLSMDTKDFISKAAESTKAFQTLKKGFTKVAETTGLDKAASGLGKIRDAAQSVKMDQVAEQVESARSKFSVLETVAVGALLNIGANISSQLISKMKSFTIDPITQGFSEYENKMGSVQTIMTNTLGAASLDDVKASLSDLNVYADKTIYSFEDMTKNLGTFTAAGVSLDKSQTAIKGLGNLAAASGASTQDMSRAMYQLSQEMAAGKVNLQGWNSVVNANMGGKLFQNNLKETAKGMGIVVDESVSFRESLQQGWLTADVLLNTLERFSTDQSMLDAATKVKTFSQLMDTAAEAVGSGWSDTWEIVFGDYQQAMDLWTGVNDWLDPIIGGFSDLRNNYLRSFRDLGGFDALYGGIGNIFTNLTNILGAVGKAFREVFPSKGAVGLTAFVKGFQTLTEKLMVSGHRLNQISAVFRGLFSIIQLVLTPVKLLAQIIGSVLAKAFGIAGAASGAFGGKILDLLTWIADIITAVNRWVQSSEGLAALMKALGGAIAIPIIGLKNLATWLQKGLVESFKGVDNWYEGFKNFGDYISRGFSSAWKDASKWVSENVKSVTAYASSIDNRVATAISGLKIAFGYLKELFSDFTEWLGKAYSMAGLFFEDGISITGFKKLGNYLKGDFLRMSGDLGSTLEIIGSSISKLAGAGFDIFIKKLKDLGVPVDEIKAKFQEMVKFLGDGLTKAFTELGIDVDSVKGKLKEFFSGISSSFKDGGIVGVLERIGEAIRTFAEGVSEKLGNSFKGIDNIVKIFEPMINGLTDVVETIKKNFDWKDAGAVGLVAGIALIAKKVWDFVNNLKEAFGNMKDVLTGTAESVNILDKIGDALKGFNRLANAGAILLVAIAIKTLVDALSELGQMKTEQIVQGLLGLVAVMGSLVAGIFAISKMDIDLHEMLGAGIAIMALSKAINNLAPAILAFSEVDPDALAYGLIALAASMVILVGGLYALSMIDGKVTTSSVGMLALAYSLKIMAGTIQEFAGLDLGTFAEGLKRVGAALLVVGAFAILTRGSNLITAGVGMAVMAGALMLVSKACESIAKMNLKKIGEGLELIGMMMISLAIGAKMLSSAQGGAVALLTMAGAVAVLAVSFKLLSSVPIKSLAASVLALGATFVILGAAAYILGPLTPALVGLSAILRSLATTFIIAAAGVALMTAAFVAMGIAGPVVTAGFLATAQLLIAGLRALIPQAIDAMVELVMGIVQAIVTNAPKVIDAGLQMMMQFLTSLLTYIPQITETGLQIIIGFLEKIREGIPQIVTVVGEIITAFLNALAEQVETIIQAGIQLMVALINGMANGLRENSQEIIDAIMNLVHSILVVLIDGLTAVITTMFSFIPGVEEGALELAESAKSKLKEAFNVEEVGSISKAPTAQFVNNIADLAPDAGSAAAGVGNAASTGLNTNQNFAGPASVGMKDYVGELINNQGNAQSAGSDVSQSVEEGLESVSMTAVGNTKGEEFSTSVGNTKSKAQSSGSQVAGGAKQGMASVDTRSTGTQVGNGFASGILDARGAVVANASSLAQAANEAFKSNLQIESPSKVMIENGHFFAQGFINGTNDMTGKVEDSSGGLAEGAIHAVQGALSRMKDFINASLDLSPVITPVLDMSNIQGYDFSGGMAIPIRGGFNDYESRSGDYGDTIYNIEISAPESDAKVIAQEVEKIIVRRVQS